jgi:outer membrane receptor for ferrienterochelin and colicin
VKTGQDELKMEMNAVYDGQGELANDIVNIKSAFETNVKDKISAVKYDISAEKAEVSSVKNELRREILTFKRE